MEKIVHKLRKHPEHVRRKILYVATLASFGILFALWAISTGTTVTSKETKVSIQQDLQPFAMLKGSVIDSASKFSWPFSKKSTDTSNTTTDTASTSTTDTSTSNTNSDDTDAITPDETTTTSNDATSNTPYITKTAPTTTTTPGQTTDSSDSMNP